MSESTRECSGVTRLTITDDSVLRAAKIPKPVLKYKKPITKYQRVKSKVTKRYFTAGSKVTEQNKRDFSKEQSPFICPDDIKLFAHKVLTKAWRADVMKKEANMRTIDKNNYATRLNQDLLHRLYVSDPKVSDMKTVLDLDPEYYSSVEGRPIKEKFDLLSYRNTMRELLKTKIIIGYREDDIMLLEENIKMEKKVIEEIKERYQIYVNLFEEFLYKDHTVSMNLLKEAETSAQIANQRYDEYKQMAKEYSGLRSVLYSLEEKWRICQMYQKFLYLISPVSWRREHDPNLEKTTEFITVEAIKEIYNKYSGFNEKSLDELMNQFLEDVEKLQEPKLFFTSPQQIGDMFQFMELQNLNSLLHSEELAEPIEAVKASMEKATNQFDAEIKCLQEAMDKLEGGILWEEERAKYLEELAHHLIQGPFKDLLIDDDVLNLHVFVEDVFESRIAQNDANLSMLDMIKAIENRYREELLLLDKLPTEQVAKLEGNTYLEQHKILKLAEDAKKQYQALERLTYYMEKAFSPPFEKTGRQIKNRSHPLNPPKPIPPPPRTLTEAETDFLTYFTDYCEHADDMRDYGINPEDNPENEDGSTSTKLNENK